MPPKRRFRPPKSKEEEKQILEECIPKSTRSSTKWAYKVFCEWQTARVNRNPRAEERSFEIDISQVQTLDANIANMSVETLNFWLTKFVQEVAKCNGERYPGRSLYMIVAGLQRHLCESGNAIRLLNQDEPRLDVFRRVLDAEMRKATVDGVDIKSKMESKDEISEEDEVALWKKGLLGSHSAKSLFRTIYFYNGKLFGLRSKEHRALRYLNFRVDSQSVTYDESVSKTYHGGLKDLKYKPRVVKHVCCAGKEINHEPCIVKCYAIYMEKIKELASQVEAFYFKPNVNSDVLNFCKMPVGINTLNKVLPDMCGEAGLERKTSHCLRVTCASRLFQNEVDEKLIRDRTGHRSSALLSYEKSNLEQEMHVCKVLGPPVLSNETGEITAMNTSISGKTNKETSSSILEELEQLDFEASDMCMEDIVSPDTGAHANVVLSGSVFNNCTFNFGK